jgi:outer membrane protein TolC
MNFQEAIALALHHSLAYEQAQKNQSIRDLQYRSSIAKLLPSIDLSTQDGLQNNVPVSSTDSTLYTPNPTAPWYSTFSLGLTETLYDNGVTLTNISIANLQREVSDLMLSKARDDLLLDVATQYYNYSLSTILLDVRKEQEELLGKQFRLLSSQYQQGFKTRADFLRLKTEVQRSEIDRLTADNNKTQSLVTLRRSLGINLGTDSPEFAPIAIERSRNFEDLGNISAPPELASFYDARIAKLQDELNDRNVDLARRKYFPQVSLTSGVSYNNQSYINANQPFAAGHELSWNTLVSLQYNLWDWGSRKRDVEIADLNRQVAMENVNLGLQDQEAKVEGLMSDLKRVARSYALTSELLSMEEESNQLVERQYREGKSTYLDLITSINNLLDARIQFYTSYFDVLQNLAKYHYYQGKIYNELVP